MWQKLPTRNISILISPQQVPQELIKSGLAEILLAKSLVIKSLTNPLYPQTINKSPLFLIGSNTNQTEFHSPLKSINSMKLLKNKLLQCKKKLNYHFSPPLIPRGIS